MRRTTPTSHNTALGYIQIPKSNHPTAAIEFCDTCQRQRGTAEPDTICDLIRSTGRPDDRLADKESEKGIKVPLVDVHRSRSV